MNFKHKELYFVKAKSVFKKIFNIFLTVFLIALIAIIVLTLVLRITGNTPSVAGYMIFRVSSGSMEPQLNVGDIILSKEISDISELKPGDIVSYKGMHGDTQGKLITHKVVKGAYSEDGKKYIVTRGIANSDDDAPVSEEQIVGNALQGSAARRVIRIFPYSVGADSGNSPYPACVFR